MILHRVGSKVVLAKHSGILSLFPPHANFIDMFFGAGGLFFNKPKAKYNICNDIDNEVFNLFMVIKEQKESFIQELTKTPFHQSLFKHWVKNKELDPILKAIRFIFLSNYSLNSKMDTMKLSMVSNTYGKDSKPMDFSFSDTEELFDVLVKSGIRFALSD